MPADGICKKAHADMLTEDEMIQAVETAAELGIHKLRLTGGEPLVKRNILSICARSAAVPGISEVCLTTNGVLLPKLALPLRQAGIRRLNISLDTLDAEKYAHITRIGKLSDVKAGLEAALSAGFEQVKINAVLIGGFNDDEIVPLAKLTQKYPLDVRFIEMMPMYDSGDFDQRAFIPYTRVLELLPEAVELYTGPDPEHLALRERRELPCEPGPREIFRQDVEFRIGANVGAFRLVARRYAKMPQWCCYRGSRDVFTMADCLILVPGETL